MKNKMFWPKNQPTKNKNQPHEEMESESLKGTEFYYHLLSLMWFETVMDFFFLVEQIDFLECVLTR